jgi:hypothetical protein
MWKQYSQEEAYQYKKFCSMLMNDATYLLDESIAKLKDLREHEALVMDAGRWVGRPGWAVHGLAGAGGLDQTACKSCACRPTCLPANLLTCQPACLPGVVTWTARGAGAGQLVTRASWQKAKLNGVSRQAECTAAAAPLQVERGDS